MTPKVKIGPRTITFADAKGLREGDRFVIETLRGFVAEKITECQLRIEDDRWWRRAYWFVARPVRRAWRRVSVEIEVRS